MAGSFTTDKVAMLHFRMPELSTSKEIKWPCHVDEHTTAENSPYDLILGLDLLTELKMVLDFEKRTLRWGDSEAEMKERGVITDTSALQLLYEMSQDSTVIKAAEERQAKILDADYSKIEMDEHVESLDYLTTEQKAELLQTLKGYPTLFGGV